MSGAETLWKIGGASVRGAGHIRRGAPNEDAIKFLLPDGEGHSIIGAVSDGHGAPAHSRSATGSRLAVEAAATIMGWDIDSADDGELDDGLAQDICEHWRNLIAEHVAKDPLTEEQFLLARGQTVLAYGATLIAMRLTPRIGQMLQIGDGDMLVGFPDGRLERPLRADEGLHGEETYSLCLNDAARHFRTASFWREDEAGWPDFAFLSTDGISKSFADEDGFRAAVSQLRAVAQSDWDALIASLPEWLNELSRNGSGDDSTACIAIRMPADQSLTGDQS